jgi:hypothetical protein
LPETGDEEKHSSVADLKKMMGGVVMKPKEVKDPSPSIYDIRDAKLGKSSIDSDDNLNSSTKSMAELRKLAASSFMLSKDAPRDGIGLVRSRTVSTASDASDNEGGHSHSIADLKKLAASSLSKSKETEALMKSRDRAGSSSTSSIENTHGLPPGELNLLPASKRAVIGKGQRKKPTRKATSYNMDVLPPISEVRTIAPVELTDEKVDSTREETETEEVVGVSVDELDI